jgi:hypothetical protein
MTKWRRREAVTSAFPAQFDSICPCCGEEIHEGDLIVRIEDLLKKKNEYVHSTCEEDWIG